MFRGVTEALFFFGHLTMTNSLVVVAGRLLVVLSSSAILRYFKELSLIFDVVTLICGFVLFLRGY